ncbi:MAG: hypothetical protein ABI216_18375 [Devosia sp.]
MSDENIIETWAKEELRPGVSPGAAARQLCRSLGAHGVAPTLKAMFEEMLADANRASFDRSMILDAFRDAAPAAAQDATIASFNRSKNREPAPTSKPPRSPMHSDD